ncbi:MAG: clostripain-related cysteine peptidase [Bacteriovoracia bacterium]
MKTTRRSKLLLASSLIWLGGAVHLTVAAAPPASTPPTPTRWELAVLFIESGGPGAPNRDVDPAFQSDIDRNVMELGRIVPNENLRLSIYREFADRAVEYFVDPASAELTNWDPLFARSPLPGWQVPGGFTVTPRSSQTPTRLREREALQRFFARAYPDPSAKRVLVIYAHGLAFDGLQVIRLNALKKQLAAALAERSLDILWLDSCFMANLEAQLELAPLARYILASEEAEFSAGTPFDIFRTLAAGPADVEKVAIDFATRFIETYSYLKQGSQRRAVERSSATLSVVDTTRLRATVPLWQTLARELGPTRLGGEAKRVLNQQLAANRMERPDLVDAGSMLLAVRRLKQWPSEAKPAIAKSADALIETMELAQAGKLHTNPRIHVVAPRKDTTLVFGFEDWTRGHRDDTETLKKIPRSMQPATFVGGPADRDWPGLTVNQERYLTPFAPGLREFSYFFVDSLTLRLLSEPQSVTRDRDYVIFAATHPDNPVLFAGYTQGIGKTAERYTGLNMLDPTLGITSIHYLDTEFFRQTHWGSFPQP